LVTIQVQGRLYTRPVLAHVTDGCTENIPTSLSIESASQNPQSRVEATGKKTHTLLRPTGVLLLNVLPYTSLQIGDGSRLARSLRRSSNPGS